MKYSINFKQYGSEARRTWRQLGLVRGIIANYMIDMSKAG